MVEPTGAPSVTAHAQRRATAVIGVPGNTFTAGAMLGLPVVLATALDAALIYGYARGSLGVWTLLSVHALLIGLLSAWITRLSRASRNAAFPLLATIAIAATGPIGGVVALITFALSKPRADEQQLLDAWYARIAMAVDTDDDTQLCEAVVAGRTPNLATAAPLSFPAVMQSGALSDRQAALGVIARRFHPDYLPALTLALKNAEPVIRVQAAAVATKLRGELRTFIDTSARNEHLVIPGTVGAITSAAQLRACIESGLLDEGDRIRAEVLAARSGSLIQAPLKITAMQAPAIIDRYAVETVLLHEQRFTEFRVGRRLARISASKRYRLRALPSSATKSHALSVEAP
jgi:hypothetical protein